MNCGRMYSSPYQTRNFAGIYDTNGRLNGGHNPPGVPAIREWLDQGAPLDMRSVMNGDFIIAKRYYSRTARAWRDKDMAEAREMGAQVESAIAETHGETSAAWNYASRVDTGKTTILFDNEDRRLALKDPKNAKLRRYLEGNRKDWREHFIRKFQLDQEKVDFE